MIKPKPSFLHVCLVHFGDISPLTFLPIWLFVFLIGFFFRENLFNNVVILTTWILASLFVTFSYLGVASGFKHYRNIISFVEHGQKRLGKIIPGISSRLLCEYEYQGRTYRISAPHSILLKKRFKDGQAVTVLVDKQSPSRAMLYELYL